MDEPQTAANTLSMRTGEVEVHSDGQARMSSGERANIVFIKSYPIYDGMQRP